MELLCKWHVQSITKNTFGTTLIPRTTAEISEENLDLAHQKARKKVFPTIDVSSTVQIIVFRPNSDTFYTATCIFICQQCVANNYDSCNLFKTYELKTGFLISKFLRSKMAVKSFEVGGDEADSSDFFVPGTIVAVASEQKSRDSSILFKLILL